MKFFHLSRLLLLSVLVLGACTTAPTPSGTEAPPTSESATPAPEETSQREGTPGTDPGPGTTTTEPPITGPVTLRIWLPPQFAPDMDTAAGALLGERLDEFAMLHPNIRISVRLKDERGAGGMVSSLAATAEAVPAALPDLVLMPRLEMERAVQSRLLQPYEQQLEPEWYDFARSLAEVDTLVYGRPFAADALVQLYRPDAVPEPPRDWTTTINTGVPLLFAGGSPDALFTLALYKAAGGRLVDETRQPYLDQASLVALFEFYADAAAAGIFPAEITGITSNEDVNTRFENGETDLAITWASSQLRQIGAGTGVTGLPTVTNVPYSLVNSWAWVLSNPSPNRLALAEELAGFLTAPEFLSSWTAAAGYLPPRADALSIWPDSPEAALASRLVLSANPLPPLVVVEKIGPVLQQMAAAVILGDMTPVEAAAAAVARVIGP